MWAMRRWLAAVSRRAERARTGPPHSNSFAASVFRSALEDERTAKERRHSNRQRQSILLINSKRSSVASRTLIGSPRLLVSLVRCLRHGGGRGWCARERVSQITGTGQASGKRCDERTGTGDLWSLVVVQGGVVVSSRVGLWWLGPVEQLFLALQSKQNVKPHDALCRTRHDRAMTRTAPHVRTQHRVGDSVPRLFDSSRSARLRRGPPSPCPRSRAAWAAVATTTRARGPARYRGRAATVHPTTTTFPGCPTRRPS